MNRKTAFGLRVLTALGGVALLAQSVLAAETTDAATASDWGKPVGAGIALGLAGLGAGISQAGVGSAAVGMLAEDAGRFGHAIIFTALPESIVILGALPLFL